MVEQPSGYGGYAYSGAPGWNNDNNNKPNNHNTNDHPPAWNNRGQGNLNHYQPQQASVKQEEEPASMPAQTGPPPLAPPPNPGLPPPPISTPQTQTAPQPQPTPTQLPANIDAAKIFVGGLSWQTTEESLRYHFEQFGEVVSVEIMRDRNTNNPRGFAFVVFSEDATVELVMKDPEAPPNGNGRFSNRVHEINHKVVDVKRAQARGLAPPSIHYGDAAEGVGVPIKAEGPPPPFAPNPYMNVKHQQPPPNQPNSQQQHAGNQTPSPESLQNKIFVGGLHLGVDRDALKTYFSQFGTVVDAIVMVDPIHRRSRGFGFVTFEDGTMGAQRAMAHNTPHKLLDKFVEIKLATPKGGDPAVGGGGGQSGFKKGGGGAPPFNPYQPNPVPSGAPPGLNAPTPGAATTPTITPNAKPQHSEFHGLAASYGRNGWRAGYGTKAFGRAGWHVAGWDDGGDAPEKSGFSFDPKVVAMQQLQGFGKHIGGDGGGSVTTKMEEDVPERRVVVKQEEEVVEHRTSKPQLIKLEPEEEEYRSSKRERSKKRRKR